MSAASVPSKGAVVVIGAGPAGLTAASELADLGYKPILLEKDPEYVGGIARTVRYKGYRFDIGGHRFFSKSPEVTKWWHDRLPNDFISVRRMSHIYYRGKFFDYPLRAFNALSNLGIFTSIGCVLSYFYAKLRPIRPERSLEAWVTNRFGAQLYRIFFKTYTEKVWGIPCAELSADWAAQRIKGLSLFQAIWNALMPAPRAGSEVVKTLLDSFYYPRFGPGMMWEKTRDDLLLGGAELHMAQTVTAIRHDGSRVLSVETRGPDGRESKWEAESFLVSMPLKETVACFQPPLPAAARAAAGRLRFRDFFTVALMVRRAPLFPDQWIYVHDPSVKVGRVQNFNNWSPELVPDAATTCLGLEYFCFKEEPFWSRSDEDLIALAKDELQRLGLVRPEEVFDGCVVRMENTYPVYYHGYQDDVRIIRDALAGFTNFQVAGRGGMHKYNNQDHAMMTGILAARNLDGQRFDVWKVNTDAEYHEEGDEVDTGYARNVPEVPRV